jgi:hypothetical protein
MNLESIEVRKLPRFLTESILEINGLLEDSNLTIRVKVDLIKAQGLLIDIFELNQTNVYLSVWGSALAGLNESKTLSSLGKKEKGILESSMRDYENLTELIKKYDERFN